MFEEMHERWRREPPSYEELAALGFDPSISFGIEFEFYARESLYDVSQRIAGLGYDSTDSGWTNQNRNHWVVKTDGSLRYSDDEDEYEYDCADCECTRDCDGDCASHFDEPEQRSCDYCDQRVRFPYDHRQEPEHPEMQAYRRFDECRDEHDYGRDLEFCDQHCTVWNYDCDECEDQGGTCDEDCSYHCEPHYYNSQHSSGDGDYGMEVTTPPMKGYQAVQELWYVLQEIKAAGGRADSDCGLHLHIGVAELVYDERSGRRSLGPEYLTLEQLKQLLLTYAKYEQAFDGLVQRNRRGNYSSYCPSVFYGRDFSADGLPTYQGVAAMQEKVEAAATRDQVLRIGGRGRCKLNLDAYTLHGTVEFRQHAGTIDFVDTLMWLILIQKFWRRAIDTGKGFQLYLSLPSASDMLRSIGMEDEAKRYWLDVANLHAPEISEEEARRRAALWEAEYNAAVRENTIFDQRREQECLRRRERMAARERSAWSLIAAAELGRADRSSPDLPGDRGSNPAQLPTAVRNLIDSEHDLQHGLREPGSFDPWVHNARGQRYEPEYPF